MNRSQYYLNKHRRKKIWDNNISAHKWYPIPETNQYWAIRVNC